MGAANRGTGLAYQRREPREVLKEANRVGRTGIAWTKYGDKGHSKYLVVSLFPL